MTEEEEDFVGVDDVVADCVGVVELEREAVAVTETVGEAVGVAEGRTPFIANSVPLVVATYSTPLLPSTGKERRPPDVTPTGVSVEVFHASTPVVLFTASSLVAEPYVAESSTCTYAVPSAPMAGLETYTALASSTTRHVCTPVALSRRTRAPGATASSSPVPSGVMAAIELVRGGPM